MSFVNITVKTEDRTYPFKSVTHAYVDENAILHINDGADTVAMFQVWESWIMSVEELEVEEWTKEEDPV